MSEQKEAQIREVIAWCEETKRKKERAHLIERNVFHLFPWMRNKTLIEIDMPLERANKHAVVYDSAMKCLWEWRGGHWAKVTKH